MSDLLTLVSLMKLTGMCTASIDSGFIQVDAALASLDDDGDGVADSADLCPDTAAGNPADTAGCSDFQKDTDGDGFRDGMESVSGYDPLLAASFPVWGDLNDDRAVDAADVLLAARAVLGLTTLDSRQLARGNVAPLVNGTPQPPLVDTFNSADLLLIQRKALDAALY